MVRLVALVLALCALAAPTASASKIKPIQDPDATATGLVTKFVTLVEKKDVAGLERFLAPGFQLQRADGVFQRGRGGWQIVAHANFNAPETK